MKLLLSCVALQTSWKMLPITKAAAVCCLFAASPWPASAQFVSDTEIRPFVVGIVPVIGPSGAVGGVSIDAKGVVARTDVEALGALREARLRALAPVNSGLQSPSALRKVSLRRIAATIDERRRMKQPVGDELQNVAGLTRVEFVFVDPEQNDIVLAGHPGG